MLKRYFAGLALIAAIAVGMLPERSDAQRWGVTVGGRGGGVTIGNMPYYGGYGYGGYGRYGGYGYGNPGYGYSSYYGRPWGGYGNYYGNYGFGSRGYYYSSPGYYYSSPGYYSYPTYSYSGSYAYTPTYSTPSYSSSGGQSYQSFYTPASQERDTAAHVMVRVPAPDAEVWFDGTATQQRGTERSFVSPQLSTGRNYSYQIRARWNDNGQMRDQTRTVSVTPGQTVTVDFSQPAGEQIKSPEK